MDCLRTNASDSHEYEISIVPKRIKYLDLRKRVVIGDALQTQKRDFYGNRGRNWRLHLVCQRQSNLTGTEVENSIWFVPDSELFPIMSYPTKEN